MSRHVLITGVAGGLGGAIAERFAAAGDRITGVDTREEPLRERLDAIAAAHGVATDAVTADLSGPDAGEVVGRAWRRSGPVDVLVNAAGIWPATPLLEMTAPMWDHVLGINTRAPMLTTVALARLAVAEGRPASVVNLASGAAIRARPGAAHYSTSKAALEMLTRSCAVELGAAGIRVNAVSPGFVAGSSQEVNPITEEYAAAVSGNPLGRIGQPDDVAAAVFFLASPEAAWTTGAVLRVDGGSSAGNPALPVHWTEPTSVQSPR
ncbi:SDR family NAD(P)-dependent oxidoreductase [Streptosporangium sandarakinum]|uniref:NAD(P)-dependent dehydrogenase (Short-subunit alcohol dehydrogenase family) n=1 Tax=Streptosporangium sandarakinum TaxID=1260955 RepID=A0A852V2M8_9ACTN|nr:SDR family oxidoreductase [Streptosporangium sandarakinum]NYF42749.1 NAD(P)-dependent dehydrogenase (short-subunit alcohol dehydrogenase family) [Streptosporangium sandarakinum]